MPPDFSSMKILMTDDDSDDRLLALLAFKKLNVAHSIDFVNNGQELIDYLLSRLDSKRELPDLILLDLNMPRKDGRQALKEIKAHPKLNQLDTIIFSTSPSERDMKDMLELGARKYIVKPTKSEDLIEIFRLICDELTARPGWHYFIDEQSSKRTSNG